jgi:hypothetical protein
MNNWVDPPTPGIFPAVCRLLSRKGRLRRTRNYEMLRKIVDYGKVYGRIRLNMTKDEMNSEIGIFARVRASQLWPCDPFELLHSYNPTDPT